MSRNTIKRHLASDEAHRALSERFQVIQLSLALQLVCLFVALVATANTKGGYRVREALSSVRAALAERTTPLFQNSSDVPVVDPALLQNPAFLAIAAAAQTVPGTVQKDTTSFALRLPDNTVFVSDRADLTGSMVGPLGTVLAIAAAERLNVQVEWRIPASVAAPYGDNEVQLLGLARLGTMLRFAEDRGVSPTRIHGAVSPSNTFVEPHSSLIVTVTSDTENGAS